METMIQPKITGYRQLSEAEVALMNEGKALAEACGAYVAKLRTHPDVTRNQAPTGPLDLQPLGNARNLNLERERLHAALQLAVWAMRAPLDDWKGECERKALDAANAALGPNAEVTGLGRNRSNDD